MRGERLVPNRNSSPRVLAQRSASSGLCNAARKGPTEFDAALSKCFCTRGVGPRSLRQAKIMGIRGKVQLLISLTTLLAE